MTYTQYIDKIVESGHVPAIIIKLADNLDNNHPFNIINRSHDEQSITKRYDRAFRKLRDAYLNINIE